MFVPVLPDVLGPSYVPGGITKEDALSGRRFVKLPSGSCLPPRQDTLGADIQGGHSEGSGSRHLSWVTLHESLNLEPLFLYLHTAVVKMTHDQAGHALGPW